MSVRLFAHFGYNSELSSKMLNSWKRSKRWFFNNLHVMVCVCQCVLLCMHYAVAAGAGERGPNEDQTRIELGSVHVLYGALTTFKINGV